MRLNLASLLVTAFLAGACVTTDYMGKSYPATTHVDMFFTMDELPASYEIMGELHAEAAEGISFAEIQEKLMEDAMANGADAIVVENIDKKLTGSQTRESEAIEGSSSTTFNEETVVVAKLVKYRR